MLLCGNHSEEKSNKGSSGSVLQKAITLLAHRLKVSLKCATKSVDWILVSLKVFCCLLICWRKKLTASMKKHLFFFFNRTEYNIKCELDKLLLHFELYMLLKNLNHEWVSVMISELKCSWFLMGKVGILLGGFPQETAVSKRKLNIGLEHLGRIMVCPWAQTHWCVFEALQAGLFLFPHCSPPFALRGKLQNYLI